MGYQLQVAVQRSHRIVLSNLKGHGHAIWQFYIKLEGVFASNVLQD